MSFFFALFSSGAHVVEGHSVQVRTHKEMKLGKVLVLTFDSISVLDASYVMMHAS